ARRAGRGDGRLHQCPGREADRLAGGRRLAGHLESPEGDGRHHRHQAAQRLLLKRLSAIGDGTTDSNRRRAAGGAAREEAFMAIAATTAAPVKIGRVRSWIVNSGPVLGIFAVIFVLWELSCWLFKVPDFILPSPSVIIDKIISSWWLLLGNGWVTAQEIVLGFGMSVGSGVSLAVLGVYSGICER